MTTINDLPALPACEDSAQSLSTNVITAPIVMGDRVRVMRGEFAFLEGTIIALSDTHARVKLHVFGMWFDRDLTLPDLGKLG
jgi:transcription antitermination factor NusG